MSLDIVIPSLNEYKNLKILLPYLKQHVPNENSRIIVVDAFKSNDDTEQLCHLYETSYLRSPHNQRAAQMNEGAMLSSAEHILFLHADVLPPPSFAELINAALKSDYDFGVFAYRFRSSKLMLKINSLFTGYDMLMAGGGDQCHFMTKTSFIILDGYNEQYDLMEDFEFFDKVKESNFRYCILSAKATVSARKYENNSWLRVNLVNLIVFTRYKLGVEPSILKRFCERWLLA